MSSALIKKQKPYYLSVKKKLTNHLLGYINNDIFVSYVKYMCCRNLFMAKGEADGFLFK
jgi:hypothetical protein